MQQMSFFLSLRHLFRNLSGLFFVLAAVCPLMITGNASAASLGIWQSVNIGKPAGIFVSGIAYGNGTWVAVGQGGFIATSPDAKTWTKRTAGITRDFNDVIFSGGRFIAVCKAPSTGSGAKIWISDDNGATWKYRNSDTGLDTITVGLHGVASDGNGNLVAVSGWPGRITRSSDNGTTWQALSGTLTNTLFGICYGKGMWIASAGYALYRSTDGGSSWTTVSTNGGTRVTFGNNRFLVADNSRDRLHWSSDGTTWRQATYTNGVDKYFRMVKGCTFYDGLFVAVTEYGDIWTSENGRQFKQWRAAGGDPDAWCIGGGNDMYIAAGGDFSLKYGTAWISPPWLRARTGSTWDYPYTFFDSEEGLPRQIGLPEYRINTASLNLVLEATLFYMQTLSAPLNMRLVYNSRPTADGADEIGLFGKNWRFRYESVIGAFGTEAQVITGGGRSYLYTTENGQDLSTASPGNPITLIPPPGVFDELKFYGPGQYFELYEKSSKMSYRYAVSGGAGGAIWRMTRITDRSGNQINLNVDGTTGRINSIADPANRAVNFTYDTVRNLCTGFTVPDGRSVSFSYDEHKNLVRITDMAGYTGSYTYDTNGFMTQMVTAGRTNQFIYKDRPGYASGTGDPDLDGDKIIFSVINPSGQLTKYEVLTNNAGIKRTDSKGGVTVFSSREGQTTRITDPLGKISQMQYGNAKLPASFTDSAGNIVNFEYDDRGNLITTVDALSNQTVMAYDSRDNLVSRTDALGKVWKYTYDGSNRVTSIETPLRNTTRFTYLNNGRLSVLRDARNHATAFVYDMYGNMTSVSDPLTNVTRFAYDSTGLRCISMTDPRNKLKSMQYDNNDRLTVIRYDSAAGAPDRVNTFDAFGQISLEDELGRLTSVTRNEFGYITSVTDPLGNRSLTEYDPGNNPVKMTDALGFVVSTTYDAANRPLVLTDAFGKTVKRQYDATGNLLSLTDKNNNKTSFKYDGNNRLIETRDSLSKAVTRNLDALGRVSTIINSRGQAIRYTYDDDGRTIKKEFKETGAGTFVQAAQFTYDANGNILSRTDGWGTTEYAYDPCNRPVTVLYPTSNSVSFTYNTAGQIASISYPHGLVVSYTYDDYNRLAIPARFRNAAGTELYGNSERANNVVRLTMTRNGVTNSMNFSYDQAGNLTGQTRANGTDTIYVYDAVQRVTNIVHRAGTNTLLQFGLMYNAVGNVLQETSAGSACIEPELSAGASMSYNACNQIVSRNGKGYTYDADGNLTAIAGGEFSAVYTPENRPAQIVRKRDSATETVRYTYDAGGLKVKSVSGSETNYFHYSPDSRLLFTTDGSGNVTAFYIWNGSLLAAVLTGDSLSAGIFYPHLNRLGSVMALTDAAGAPVEKYAYQPYGLARREAVQPGGAVSNFFTFAGGLGVQDEGGGIFYMKNRFYDANTGRFLQRDPVGFEGGFNLYAYVAGNPVNNTDPSGLLNFDGDHVDRFLASTSGDGPGKRMALDLSVQVFHKAMKQYVFTSNEGKVFYDAARGKGADDIAVTLFIKSPLKTMIMGGLGWTSGGASIAISLAIDAAEPAVSSAVKSTAEYAQQVAQENYQKLESAAIDTEFMKQMAEVNDPMNWIPQF